MPNPVLYVLPENHFNRQDQERRAALCDLAYFGAINVLLENTYVHDTSGQSGNLYGIEDQEAHNRADVIHHYINAANAILPLLTSDRPQFDLKLQTARNAARQEVRTLQQKGSLQKQTVSQELERYISNWPNRKEDEIENKYLFYKRNYKICNNIKNIVQNVLGDANKPRVFALSIGAGHIDSTNLNPSNHYQGKKDLPTILGNTITAGSSTVQVIYGTNIPVTVQTIAEKALELSDNLSWATKLVAIPRLKFYIYTGL